MEANVTTLPTARAKRTRPAPPPKAAYRAHDLAAILGVSLSTVWRWNEQGRIPKGRAISPGVTIWNAAEIDAWLNGPKAA